MMQISNKDITIFLLITIIAVSMSWFAGGINDFVRTNGQSAQVQYAGGEVSAPLPLVVLTVTPGIVSSGSSAIVSWDLSRNADACSAVSSPHDPNWSGTKLTGAGVNTQNVGPITADTLYLIRCTEANGKTSVSSMTVIAR